LGGIICIGSIAFFIFYLWWLFLSQWSEWAVKVPVFILVAGFLFIVAWIGWTMAVTPAPTPIEEKPPEKTEEQQA
jgi:hypothetical protein